MTSRTLRARWLVVEPQTVLENSVLELSNDRIGAIRVEAVQRAPARRVILPGLVNAHVHLDLTALGAAGLPRGPFVSWARALMEERSRWSPADLERSVTQGIAQTLASGVTAVGDIDGTGTVGRWRSTPLPRGIAFRELLGFLPGEAEARIAEARRELETEELGGLSRGLSPHAPYSCSASLYRGLDAIAATRGLPLTTHVAETREELELLARGTGPLRELLESLAKLPEGWRAPGRTPIEYLEGLGVLRPELLLVHANYLGRGDVERIAASGAAVVYCPRSHAFFEHEPHPWRELLAAGVPVALGTDSLASNDSLDVFDEMRFLVDALGASPRRALELATLGGARALGRDDLGHLSAGACADLVVLELAEDIRAEDVLRAVLDPRSRVVETWIGGRCVWSDPDSASEASLVEGME